MYVAMFTAFKILFFFFYLCVPDKDACAQHAEMHRLHCNVKYDAKLHRPKKRRMVSHSLLCCLKALVSLYKMTGE